MIINVCKYFFFVSMYLSISLPRVWWNWKCQWRGLLPRELFGLWRAWMLRNKGRRKWMLWSKYRKDTYLWSWWADGTLLVIWSKYITCKTLFIFLKYSTYRKEWRLSFANWSRIQYHFSQMIHTIIIEISILFYGYIYYSKCKINYCKLYCE